MLDGNDAQNREIIQRVAQQAVDLYKREQENERRGFSIDKAATWVALITAIGGVLWQAAVTTQRVNETVRRVENIEALGFDKNFARLEAKVDLLVEERSRNLDNRNDR